MKKIVRLNESQLIELVKRVIKEQSSNMLSFEKVVEVPNTSKDNLFMNLKNNRELFRNGSLRSENQGSQLNITKKVMLDKNMYKSLGFSLPVGSICWYGPLEFDITIIVKDNKYKIICDNFIWINSGSGCQSKMSLNPISDSKPKGWTIGYTWETVSNVVKKYVDSFLNQVTTVKPVDDF